jgi:hypothetical protein
MISWYIVKSHIAFFLFVYIPFSDGFAGQIHDNFFLPIPECQPFEKRFNRFFYPEESLQENKDLKFPGLNLQEREIIWRILWTHPGRLSQ